ncbi:MAG TPA: FAD-binding oxidoreductase [Candidatus Obscuribacterales bacterium]
MSHWLAFIESAVVVASHEGPGVAWAHVRFDAPGQVAQFLHDAAAAGVPVIPAPPRALPARLSAPAVAFADLSGLSGISEFSPEDQVIDVGSGMTLAELDGILAEKNLWWPVLAADEGATVAGVIGSGDGGCLEHGFGGPRDLVLGLTVALPSGDLTHCGGRVVKNVTGYDLKRLFTGSRHWLGLVCAASLRLYARPAASASLLFRSAAPEPLLAAAKKLLGSTLPLSCLELVDARMLTSLAARDRELGIFTQACQLADAAGFCAMIVRVDGHDEVVREVAAELAGRHDLPREAVHEIERETAARMWRGLCDFAGASTPAGLEVSASICQLETLLPALIREVGMPVWQVRPRSGRLRLYASDAEELARLRRRIREHASVHAERLTLASGDDEYEYRVEALPEDDPAHLALKRAIKERFDPGGILNPLVLP